MSAVGKSVLAILPRDDHNGFFSFASLSGRLRDDPLGVRLYLAQAGDVDELKGIISRHATLIDALVVCGHGTPRSLQLGKSAFLGMANVRGAGFDLLSARCEKIVLLSCETGQTGRHSLAAAVSRSAGRVVYAPSRGILHSDVIINPDYGNKEGMLPVVFPCGVSISPAGEVFGKPIDDLLLGGVDKVVPFLEPTEGLKLLIQRGKIDQAIAYADRAVIHPKATWIRENLIFVGEAFSREGRHLEAVRLYQKGGIQESIKHLLYALFDRREFETLFKIALDANAPALLRPLYNAMSSSRRMARVQTFSLKEEILYNFAVLFLEENMGELACEAAQHLSDRSPLRGFSKSCCSLLDKTHLLDLAKRGLLPNWLLHDLSGYLAELNDIENAVDIAGRITNPYLKGLAAVECIRNGFVEESLALVRDCTSAEVLSPIISLLFSQGNKPRAYELMRRLETDKEKYSLVQILIQDDHLDQALEIITDIRNEKYLTKSFEYLVEQGFVKESLTLLTKIESQQNLFNCVEALLDEGSLLEGIQASLFIEDQELLTKVFSLLLKRRHFLVAFEFFAERIHTVEHLEYWLRLNLKDAIIESDLMTKQRKCMLGFLRVFLSCPGTSIEEVEGIFPKTFTRLYTAASMIHEDPKKEHVIELIRLLKDEISTDIGDEVFSRCDEKYGSGGGAAAGDVVDSKGVFSSLLDVMEERGLMSELYIRSDEFFDEEERGPARRERIISDPIAFSILFS